MLVAALKQRIEALPGNLFTQAWKCIEEIDAALNKAGSTAVLALDFTRAVHEKRLAEMVAMQQARIAALLNQVREQSARERTTVEEANRYSAALEKLQRKLAKAKKKSK